MATSLRKRMASRKTDAVRQLSQWGAHPIAVGRRSPGSCGEKRHRARVGRLAEWWVKLWDEVV